VGFGAKTERVPSGTAETGFIFRRFLSRLRGLRDFGARLPSDKSLGYFRESLRDWHERRRGEMSLVVPLDEIFANETRLLAKHDSWERVELGKVCKILNGFPFKSALFNSSEGFPVIRIRDIARSSTETFYNGDFPPEYVVTKGDLLIGMDGNFRCCEWLGRDAGLNQRVCKIIPDEKILHRQFLFYGLNGYLKAIEDVTSSVTVGHLSSRDVQRIPFPLPPLAEQQRIVEKLEAMLGKLDASQQRLVKMPTLLKRFRQSVLAAACSGRLTADWREENSGSESAQSLTEQINEVRKKSPKAQKVEFTPEDEWPDDPIPATWTWVRFGSVIGELRNGVPLRPNIEPPGIPILRISAARPGAINLDDFRFMPDGEQFVPQFTLRDNDLIFTRYNGTIEFLGTCGMVRGLGKKTLLYPDKLMRVRFDHDSILPAYAEVFFQAPHVHERVVAKSKSSAGQNGISGSDIKGQPFALPPLAEQQEIVRRVEGLFALADQLEVRLAEVRGQVAKLTPSLLARAFAGQLVPQNPTDEPAEKLLERIRQKTYSQERI
jgi:type I restriction enzyme, S subunit